MHAHHLSAPGYALERAGSSGQAICPDVAIVDDAGEQVRHGRVAQTSSSRLVVVSAGTKRPGGDGRGVLPRGMGSRPGTWAGWTRTGTCT